MEMDTWNETPASLSISIDPPWWKTNLAYFGYLITAFGILYGGLQEI